MGASRYILIQRITWTRLIEYSMKQHIPLQELGISTICQERQEWQLARQSSVAQAGASSSVRRHSGALERMCRVKGSPL